MNELRIERYAAKKAEETMEAYASLVRDYIDQRDADLSAALSEITLAASYGEIYNE